MSVEKSAGCVEKELGFTLLELLLALSLMAVLITLMFGAFYSGSRAWEKGEQLTRSQQFLRVVPELVRKQLASVSMPETIKEDGKWFFLRGDDKFVEFFSNVSLYPQADAGLVYVRYRITAMEDQLVKLSFFEQDMYLLDADKLPDIEETSYVDLLSGYTSMSFAYLTRGDGDDGITEWLSAWNPEEMEGEPLAIKFTFREAKSDQELYVVVPVLVGHKENVEK